jgi:hypothetical protein
MIIVQIFPIIRILTIPEILIKIILKIIAKVLRIIEIFMKITNIKAIYKLTDKFQTKKYR